MTDAQLGKLLLEAAYYSRERTAVTVLAALITAQAGVDGAVLHRDGSGPRFAALAVTLADALRLELATRKPGVPF